MGRHVRDTLAVVVGETIDSSHIGIGDVLWGDLPKEGRPQGWHLMGKGGAYAWDADVMEVISRGQGK
jgi:hypothetical protein